MATVNDLGPLTKSRVVDLGGKAASGDSNARRALRRLIRHKMALFGLFLLAVILTYVIIGSFVFTEAQSNYTEITRTFEAPSAQHPFGTDEVGRDIMVRTIYGGQISLFIGITAVIVEILVGTMIGLAAGFFGGVIDALLMRFVEAMLSIPQLFIGLIAVRVLADKIPDFNIGGREFSSTLVVLIFVIGLTSWMQISRIVRSMVLSLKEQEFVTAAHSIGASQFRIVFRHILPNVSAPLIVAATLGVAQAILVEAYLSFLGLGVRPPTATWGNMLEGAYSHLNVYYMWLFPSLFVIVTVLGVNFFGDGLRDALDPKGNK